MMDTSFCNNQFNLFNNHPQLKPSKEPSTPCRTLIFLPQPTKQLTAERKKTQTAPQTHRAKQLQPLHSRAARIMSRLLHQVAPRVAKPGRTKPPPPVALLALSPIIRKYLYLYIPAPGAAGRGASPPAVSRCSPILPPDPAGECPYITPLVRGGGQFPARGARAGPRHRDRYHIRAPARACRPSRSSSGRGGRHAA